MRVLVTGSWGKVGSATVTALLDAGHEVTACDLGPPVFERGEGAAYRRADFTDAGDAFAVVRGDDAVIHAAAIPDPQHHPPHVVFSNNLQATFNTLESPQRAWLVGRRACSAGVRSERRPRSAAYAGAAVRSRSTRAAA